MEVGPPSAICPFRTVAGGTAMQTVARVCSWVAVVVAVTFSPRAEAIGYAGGSLIIPTQSSYPDYCGTASPYGPVYKLLRANDGLPATGKSAITRDRASKGPQDGPQRGGPPA